MAIRKRPRNIKEFIDQADKKPAKVKAFREDNREKKENSFKNMSATFDLVEYELLKQASKLSNRSMKGYIRYAVSKVAKEELNLN